MGRAAEQQSQSISQPILLRRCECFQLGQDIEAERFDAESTDEEPCDCWIGGV